MKQYKRLLLIIILILVVICLLTVYFSTDLNKRVQNQTHSSTSTVIPTMDKDINSSHNVSVGGSDSSDSNLSIITGTGIIQFQDLEGGAYIIKSDDGHHYQPLSLPPDLKVNGTKVTFQLRPVHDAVSIIMSGDPVEVISIEPVDGSRIANRSESLISFEKSGGTTGSYEELKIFPDKHGEITKWSQIHSINLSDNEMDNLTSICNKMNITAIKPQTQLTNPSPNAIIYTIRYKNQTIKATNGSIPNLLEPMIIHLDKILEQYTVSPINSNRTLSNTAWYLTTYLRKDGIPVRLSNDTRISVTFDKNGSISGTSGCNLYNGQYSLSGNNLSFSRISMTRTTCQDQIIMETESAYIKLLNQVMMVSGQDKNLTMADRNNTALLTYSLIKG
ncbi:META domain-containing protein [Methanospirillum lacunae]|uniref:DUF306 domain-containing protein n=1 Tax=Methanospirillum lacunae TaxID=668570 RepID=A0A2V2ND56_9EURY|nr:META domain-containing protein [Methanospirillum lacunae]PWR74297.1 hypothetical protein DK846_03895 [Methanospirillum lacunae]